MDTSTPLKLPNKVLDVAGGRDRTLAINFLELSLWSMLVLIRAASTPSESSESAINIPCRVNVK
jgi:hypothetical protein